MYIMLSNILIIKTYWRPIDGFTLVMVLVMAMVCCSSMAQTAKPGGHEHAANVLREKHASLSAALANNVYGRPLSIDSIETSSRVTGNVYVVLDAPIAVVSSIKAPRQLCEVIILHINTKYCHATAPTSPSVLLVNFGKKIPQALSDTFDLEFVMTSNPPSPGFVQVSLNAVKGPLGTSDYAIEVAAIPLADGKTFLHLTYSYGFGMAGRIAMQAYLATAGSSKVGFTQVADAAQSQSKAKVYVGGMRGAVERNTMRYYLAIDAYLQSLNAPQPEQQRLRLEKWFDSTEQYALQLRETEKDSYIAMKKDEITRQQSARPRL